jgi:hypothetical protein
MTLLFWDAAISAGSRSRQPIAAAPSTSLELLPSPDLQILESLKSQGQAKCRMKPVSTAIGSMNANRILPRRMWTQFDQHTIQN